MTFSYAAHADVLYITLQETKAKCTYAEISQGIVCRIDESQNKVVGITITDFSRRLKSGEPISIPELNEGLSADSLLQFD